MEDDGGGVRKRKRGGEADGDGVGGMAAEGDEEEEEEEYEGIAEEAVAEVMRWLEMEISLAAGEAATSPEKAAAAQGPGFVTISGNEESCGPSFSAAASTVMASVDTRAGAPPPPSVPWPWPCPAAPGEDEEQVVVVDSADEEWLVELLTGGPTLEGQ